MRTRVVGAVPGNKDRGYVVRSILRRAERFGRQYLKTKEPFLHGLVPTVVELMGPVFPELKTNPKRVIDVSAQIGLRLPAIASSLGRILLAALDDAALDDFLARVTPRKLTPTTVVDKRALRKAILKVRADGFSHVDQEVEVGFRSISVPLRRLDGKVVASLNIGAQSERSSARIMLNMFLPKLRETAEKLQQQLV